MPIPHRKRSLVSYWPTLQNLVTEYKLVVQLATLVIFVGLATGHDQHLANTFYELGIDILGDGALIPRNILTSLIHTNAAQGVSAADLLDRAIDAGG